MATSLQTVIDSDSDLWGLKMSLMELKNQEDAIVRSKMYDMQFPRSNGFQEDYDEAIDDVQESIDMYDYVIADLIGLENLRTMRRMCGVQMNELYRKQQDAYKAQKNHYEACKARGYFTEEDKCFIQQKKLENENIWNLWDAERLKREDFCRLIESLDPEDADLGWDEE